MVEGAKLIYEAGADGIDINGAYGGYMGDQFTTDVFNHRTDEFGGSMDGQLRVLTEIVKRIKKETAQDCPVTCRLGTKHYMRLNGRRPFLEKFIRSMAGMWKSPLPWPRSWKRPDTTPS